MMSNIIPVMDCIDAMWNIIPVGFNCELCCCYYSPSSLGSFCAVYLPCAFFAIRLGFDDRFCIFPFCIYLVMHYSHFQFSHLILFGTFFTRFLWFVFWFAIFHKDGEGHVEYNVFLVWKTRTNFPNIWYIMHRIISNICILCNHLNWLVEVITVVMYYHRRQQQQTKRGMISRWRHWWSIPTFNFENSV